MTTESGPDIPAQYLSSSSAPEPRTLIDILHATAARYPDAPALDDGEVQLTYAELIADIDESVAWLAARGIGRGDRIGIRMPSGSYALYVAILAALAAGAAYVPVDADDPQERADLVFGEAQVVAIITELGLVRGPGSSRGWRAGPPMIRDDAWIIFTSGLDRHAEGRGRHPPQRGRLRRRRGPDLPAGQPDRTRRPGARRAVRRVRRLLRGDVAGVAVRRLPGPRTALAGAQRHGPRPVAGVPRHHRGVHGADARRAVARRGARSGAAADLRRRGLPTRARRAARRRGPRGVEHLRPHRGDRRGLRGPASAAARSASACRCPAGTSRSSTRTATRSPSARSASW